MRFLCKLGIHRWFYWDKDLWTEQKVEMKRRCMRCPKTQWYNYAWDIWVDGLPTIYFKQ